MEGLVMAAQMLLCLSILVGVHELGHLVAAKAFGMRVEKFSIGFPPKIFGVKWGETEYSIGALPIGGFVKISGMIDESLDTQQMQSEPKPWEYRSKPAWQRLIVMLGGIAVNIVTGIAVFVVMVYTIGEVYYAISEVNKHGVYVNELGREIGLEKGDKIIKINGKEFNSFNDVRNPNLLLASGSYYTVVRDGDQIDIPIPNNFIERLSEKDVDRNFVSPLQPFKVGEVMAGRPAEAAGLKEGDKILTAAGEEVAYFQDFREIVLQHKGERIDITVERPGNSAPITLNVTVTKDGTIGFYSDPLLEISRKKYTFMESIPKGTAEAFGIITVQLKAFSKIFKGEVSASNSISGPIGIAKIFGGTWDWYRFWNIMGMLSMVLAFMNLLPIPALDGGHVTFLLYEIISGTPPSEKFLEAAQKVGLVLLLGIMAFAIGNDIYKF